MTPFLNRYNIHFAAHNHMPAAAIKRMHIHGMGRDYPLSIACIFMEWVELSIVMERVELILASQNLAWREHTEKGMTRSTLRRV